MKRFFAAASFSFAAAVYIGQYAFSGYQLVWAAGVCAFLFICCLFIRLPAALRISKPVLLMLAAGFLYLYGYHAFLLDPVESLDGQTNEISAEALDYSQASAYGYRVTVRANIPDDGLGRTVKATLYLDPDSPEILPGDRITVKASLAAASFSGEEWSWYRSDGIFLRAVQKGELSVSHPENLPITRYPAVASRYVSEHIDAVFNQKDAAFVRALLLGDTARMSQSFSSALSASGIYHVVSVSGMNVAFLVGMVLLLIRNKRAATLIAIPVIIIFMAITGFPPSVVRAGVMQIMALCAFLIRREADAVTSMGLALFILLLINPYAASDVGLQLSFCATLGILLFTRRISDAILNRIDKKIKAKRVLGFLSRLFIYTLASTLSALIFTVPLTCYYFGMVSIVSPAVNLVTMWAVSCVFCISFIAAVLSLIWLPLGVVAGYITWPLIRYIELITTASAKLPYSSADAGDPFILAWLVFVYAVVLLYILRAFLKRKDETPAKEVAKRPFGFIIPVGAIICALCLSLLLSSFKTAGSDIKAAVLDVGQGQCVVVTSNAYTAVIDCGGSRNAGATAAKYLRGIGRTQIDILILTHFHEDHANGALTLMDSLSVKGIAFPELSEEDGLYGEISDAAVSLGMPVYRVSEDLKLYMGTARFDIYAPESGAYGENERGLSVLCSQGGFELLITGDLNADSERRLSERVDFPDIEMIVAGHHGSKNSSSEELLIKTKPDVAVVSVGKNSYGHPAQEALDRLSKVGARVYRTDENKTVEIDLKDAA